METINPKNYIDIDPSLVSFITLKDGNMIMLDESTPIKPSKDKNNIEAEKTIKNEIELKEKNLAELSIASTMNIEYKGNKKDIFKELKLSNEISFYYNKIEKKKEEKNMPSPNSSIDFKSSMLQSKKDITNLNINNSNIINKNIYSEDNVNIHMTETLISKQNNENKNEENIDNKKLIEDPIYTFKEKENYENDYPLQMNQKIEKKEKEINYKKITINNNNKKNSSLAIQNNNNFNIKEKMTDFNDINNDIKRNTMTEIDINEDKKEINKTITTTTYNKINKRKTISSLKDNNYIKAVISINIPGEEKKNTNIVTQFNSLVDRLNGKKSKGKIKNIKKSDKYYELYKNYSENYILNKILSPKKIKKKIPYEYFSNHNNKFKDISSFLNNSETSTISSGKGSNLNSRIMALKERTHNNSFRSNEIENGNNNDKSDIIVFPSNFLYSK